jgi:hypothetical protein
VQPPITSDCEVNFLDAIHKPTPGVDQRCDEVFEVWDAVYHASADLARHDCNGRVEVCMEEGHCKLIRFKSSWLCGEVSWSSRLKHTTSLLLLFFPLGMLH